MLGSILGVVRSSPSLPRPSCILRPDLLLVVCGPLAEACRGKGQERVHLRWSSRGRFPPLARPRQAEQACHENHG
eukprot:3794864-Rhodomonas_salina.1